METNSMTEDLKTIDEWLQRYAPASHRTLQPGLDEARLRLLEGEYGFKLHTDLRTLLSWHNGCHPVSAGLPLWDDFYFERSEDMVTNSFRAAAGWRPRWVPFATDMGLNTIAVDHTTKAGTVLLVDGGGGGIHQAWPSLAHLVTAAAEALQTRSNLEDRRPVVANGYLTWE